jgi:hypothetical protein
MSELSYGFSIINIHHDRPEKVRFGDGMRFYTNAQFGDLVLLSKMAIAGEDIREACLKSGVERRRARRFLKAVGIKFISKRKRMSGMKYLVNKKRTIKRCDVCLMPMLVLTRRQKRHKHKCKRIYSKFMSLKYTLKNGEKKIKNI